MTYQKTQIKNYTGYLTLSQAIVYINLGRLMEVPLSPWLLELLLITVLLPFSMVFSLTESAFNQLSENDFLNLKENNTPGNDKLLLLLNKYSDQTFLTILLCNLLANISVVIIAYIMVRDLPLVPALQAWLLPLTVIFAATTLLLFGGILPKTLALKNPLLYARKLIYFNYIFFIIFFPVTYLLAAMIRLFTRKVSSFKNINELTQQNIIQMMEADSENVVLQEDEKNMITSIFEFGKTTAKEIMVPRVDMVVIDDEISLDDLLTVIKDDGFSRIPVYHDSIDNIIGVLYIKDLIPMLNQCDFEFQIASLVRSVSFIPESKEIGSLLKMFQKDKIHIAVVVDEYGGTSGMITMEDIIEEIVGEIQDEFDTEEKLHRKISDICYEFDAKISIDDVNEILSVNLPDEEDYESLGGFVYFVFGEVPEIGDNKQYENMDITILSIDKQRIGWVKIELIADNE